MAGSGSAHLRGGDAVLTVRDLDVEFAAPDGHTVHAVSGLSFDLRRGETLGLVGESGCGKSSAARAVLQLPPPRRGLVVFQGTELTRLRGEELRRARRQVQMIFQDPVASLNPRRTAAAIAREGLEIWDLPRSRGREMLEAVGLDPDTVGDRRPRELSGGQCQRVSIARALAVEPTVLICDEPVSALDVSVQAQILNLLEDAKDRYGLSVLFIGHDLAVVKHVSDRVLVMYLGKLCEVADSDSLYRAPAHPYTRMLLDSIPRLDTVGQPSIADAGDDVPSPLAPPSGCRFRTRCPKAQARCAIEEPVVREVARGHHVACHFPEVASA